jgi:tetratricopeptide (TPR) repeat protein
MKSLSTILATLALACATTGAPAAGKQSPVLRQAREYSYEVRRGRFEVIPQEIALLERATAADPNDAALWDALGVAYLHRVAALANRPDADRAALRLDFQRALAAFERALQIDPNDPDALAGHGMALTVSSAIERQPEWAARGVAEMDRAVALQPRGVRVRLTRAFTGINLRAPLRKTQVIIDDLAFLLQIADGTRAGDVMRIALGDVYAETGAMALARREYALADRPGSTAQDASRLRLAALDRGQLPVAEAAELRSRLGGDCMMCHAD